MLISFLKTHLRPYRRALLVLLVLQVVQTMATLLQPTFYSLVVDRGVVRGDIDAIRTLGTAMIGVALLQILAAIGAAALGARVAAALGRDLRSRVFRRVMGVSAREVARFGAPSLITRTTNDVQQVQALVVTLLDIAVAATITCVGGVVMALVQDVSLSLIIVALVMVLVVGLTVILVRISPTYGRMQRGVESINRLLREQISGIRIIRAFVRDDHERARFGEANTELFGVGMKVGRMMATIPVVVMMLMNTATLPIIWFATQRIDAGQAQLGSISALLGYVTLIITAIIMATVVFADLPRAAVSVRRVQEVLDTGTSVPVPEHPVRGSRLHGQLRIRAAGFRYPGASAPVLHDVELVAEPGQTVAIVGSTGSGKTTLLNLALRLYDTTSGSVHVNGIDVREYDPEALHSVIGIVPQEPQMFSGTIASNLCYGRPIARDRELWHALEIAQARDFVERLPGMLSARVTQGGSNLSGGQRQRLAIARALVLRPEIYLLDDSFSALDRTTEARLREALGRAVPNATMIVVAQRISAVQNADRIVVLDQGRVVGTGTHAELLHRNRTYQEIAHSQALPQEVPPRDGRVIRGVLHGQRG
ncbi:ABC transporter ATP-binding protein [Saccharopolyspora sp. TS4A08]|uniref:ABC transporter ATP-binding protein n=1 Tax=Saccharopolyspora ipomoeae TaxID=3042027 RepID=A0ABT6PU24_9PSEU|nr:ABC transporter ATP-binding protein [Saccharopolyspora sp. TS4A08]MDI2031365.1 ABC transporter ATP-binding protein [Saccharopolyspora sp. TS4A08]